MTTGASPDSRFLNFRTYNIRLGIVGEGEQAWEARKKKVISSFEHGSFAATGVQEAYRFQLDDILEHNKHIQAFGCGRDDGKSEGEHTAIILGEGARMVQWGNFWLSETPDIPGSVGWDAACPRTCTYARILTGQGTVLFANTHWDHVGSQARENSAELMIDILRRVAEDLPLVVVGDFNECYGSAGLKRLASGLGLRVVSDVSRTTYHNWQDPNEKGPAIDHILASDHLMCRSSHVMSNHAGSDHWMVSAELIRYR